MEKEIRKCSQCGKPMLHGYTLYDEEYVCSDKCLLKSYGGDKKAMEADFADSMNEGDSECFWTCWPSMYFDEDELTIDDLRYMWNQLGNIPTSEDEDGCLVIDEAFAVTDGYGLTKWEAGEAVCVIWQWFDNKCPNGLAKDLLYPVS